MQARTYVIGVGMTKFDKPGAKEGDYPDWAKEAGEMALRDGGVGYEQVEQAFVGVRGFDLQAPSLRSMAPPLAAAVEWAACAR